MTMKMVMMIIFVVGINSKSFPWPVRSAQERTPKSFAVDDRMQITALCDIFVITGGAINDDEEEEEDDDDG